MAKLCSVLLIISLAVFVSLAEGARYDSRGFLVPEPARPFVNSRYYQNRDFYKNREFFNNFYKRYNPDVAAPDARILEQDNVPNHDGSYSYSYETENGIHGEERGVPVPIGGGEQKEVVEGAYSFLTPEGLRVNVRYTADENGFHPTISFEGHDSEAFAAQPHSADVVILK